MSGGAESAPTEFSIKLRPVKKQFLFSVWNGEVLEHINKITPTPAAKTMAM